MKLLPDSMPGSAQNILDNNIVRSGSNGDTIVSGADDGIQDLHIVHIRLQVDSVGVGAPIRTVDRDPLDQHSVRVVELQMHLRRGTDRDPEDFCIRCSKKTNTLRTDSYCYLSIHLPPIPDTSKLVSIQSDCNYLALSKIIVPEDACSRASFRRKTMFYD